MKKFLMLGFISILLLIPNAQATCLDSEQLLTLAQITEETNTSTSVLLSIFDELCNITYGYYSESEVDAIINETRTELIEQLNEDIQSLRNNVTTELEYLQDNITMEFFEIINEEADIAEALIAMTQVVNASNSVAQIEDIIDRKNIEYIDQIDDRIRDMRYELEDFASIETLEDLEKNLSTKITLQIARQNQQQPATFPVEIYYVIGAFLIILVYLAWQRRKSDKETKYLMDQSPKVDRRRSLTEHEITQLAENKRLKELAEEHRKQHIEKEKKVLEKQIAKEIEKPEKPKKEKPSEDVDRALDDL